MTRLRRFASGIIRSRGLPVARDRAQPGAFATPTPRFPEHLRDRRAARKRLRARHRRLSNAGKVTAAVAREPAGFLMPVACEMAGRPRNSRAVT